MSQHNSELSFGVNDSAWGFLQTHLSSDDIFRSFFSSRCEDIAKQPSVHVHCYDVPLLQQMSRFGHADDVSDGPAQAQMAPDSSQVRLLQDSETRRIAKNSWNKKYFLCLKITWSGLREFWCPGSSSSQPRLELRGRSNHSSLLEPVIEFKVHNFQAFL